MDTAKQIIDDISWAGLSDEKIAKMVGCSQPTIWRIRNDKTGSCSSALYIELAKLRKSLNRMKKAA